MAISVAVVGPVGGAARREARGGATRFGQPAASAGLLAFGEERLEPSDFVLGGALAFLGDAPGLSLRVEVSQLLAGPRVEEVDAAAVRPDREKTSSDSARIRPSASGRIFR